MTVTLKDNATVFGVETHGRRRQAGRFPRLRRGQGHRREDPRGRGAHLSRDVAGHRRRPAPVGRQARRGDDQRHRRRHRQPIGKRRRHPGQIQGRQIRIHGRPGCAAVAYVAADRGLLKPGAAALHRRPKAARRQLDVGPRDGGEGRGQAADVKALRAGYVGNREIERSRNSQIAAAFITLAGLGRRWRRPRRPAAERVRGTIEKVDGATLTVKSRDGT